MPITTLDPKTALIVIDLQAGIVSIPSAHPMEDVIANAAALTAAFRAKGLPVALVNVDSGAPGRTEASRAAAAAGASAARPDGWTVLLPELDQQPTDVTVTKKTWGAFSSTDLDEQLKARGVTQVVVIGVATSAGVESTARHAHELGYHVTLAVDAMTDANATAHENSVAHIFPRIGETGTTAEIIALLDGAQA